MKFLSPGGSSDQVLPVSFSMQRYIDQAIKSDYQHKMNEGACGATFVHGSEASRAVWFGGGDRVHSIALATDEALATARASAIAADESLSAGEDGADEPATGAESEPEVDSRPQTEQGGVLRVAGAQASDVRIDEWLSRRHGGTEVDEDGIGTEIVDCAVRWHRDLGAGLLETVYEVTLARAVEDRGFEVHRQAEIGIEYQGMRFDEGFRADLIVGGLVIEELKSVGRVTSAHRKQLLTYLRLTGLRLGYLLNFGEALMRDGIARMIDGASDSDPPCLGASVREGSDDAVDDGLVRRGSGRGSALAFESMDGSHGGAETRRWMRMRSGRRLLIGKR